MGPSIAGSARKHGVSVDDMRHAVRHPVLIVDKDDGFVLYLGPARDSRLLEVGLAGDPPRIVHAMVARKSFERMVVEKGQDG